MRTDTLPAGRPPSWRTCTPGILAAIISRKSALVLLVMSSAFIETIDVVTSRRFWTPYPITIASSMRMLSCLSVAFAIAWVPETGTSSVSNPMQDISRTISLSETRMEYLPSISVDAPFMVPFSITIAATTGVPSLSVTIPETVRAFCANPAIHAARAIIRLENFFISQDFVLEYKFRCSRLWR